jgi:hypothetical protein
VHFGIQKADTANDPPSVLTWQIGVTDIDAAMERCMARVPAADRPSAWAVLDRLGSAAAAHDEAPGAFEAPEPLRGQRA